MVEVRVCRRHSGGVFLRQRRRISRPVMRPLGKSLEKTSVESKGKSSGEGPGPAGHWDRFGEFDIYSKIHWLHERISCLVLEGLC